MNPPPPTPQYQRQHCRTPDAQIFHPSTKTKEVILNYFIGLGKGEGDEDAGCWTWRVWILIITRPVKTLLKRL